MPNRHWMRAFPPLLALILVLSACGPGATPTATPAAAIPTAVAPRPALTAGATPTTASAASANDLKVSPYPPEKLKALVADGFLVHGMQFARGEEPQYGGTAIFTHRMDIPSSDPMVTSTISLTGLTKEVTGAGSLVRPKQENNWEVEGYLAQSWETSADFKEWTFKLHPDIKWHDGAPLTAQDIKFWIDLAVFPPAGRKQATFALGFGPLKEVQVIDPLTVRFIEKEPVPFLLETMPGASAATSLSHKRDLTQKELDKGNIKVNMSDLGWVSVGPFKIDKYDVGSRFKVVRNPYYFEKDEKGRQMPYLDGIDNPIIPDSQTGVSAFRAGRVDGTARGSGYHLNPGQVMSVKKDLKGKVWFARSFYSGWGVIPNATVAPFNELKLRKAVQLFIDRDEWAQLAYGGYASPGGATFPGSFWANPAVVTWPGYNPATKKQDREEALRLVKEAGYTNARFGILCRDNYLFNCEAADSQLRQMGLNSYIDIADTNRQAERSQTGQYQTQLGSLGADLPGNLLTAWLTTNPLATNKAGDTKIDDYDKRLSTTVDPMKRRDLVWEVEKYLLQDQVYAFPGPWEEATVAYRTYIKGMWVSGANPLGNNSHQTVWMDQKLRG